MKAIKSILICAITSLTIQSVAQAQSTPEFCKIHAGNVNRYVSRYDIFNHTAPTIYRPFISNNQAYKINQQLAAKPLFYTALSNGNIVAAFQLKGKYGNDLIPDRDVVTQHIILNSTSSYSEILGFCVNGTFAASPKTITLDLYKLPLDTQSALQEAKLGISRERVSNMFR